MTTQQLARVMLKGLENRIGAYESMFRMHTDEGNEASAGTYARLILECKDLRMWLRQFGKIHGFLEAS